MNKIIKIFGKEFNLYLYANKLPLPIISIAICDDSFVGLMIISVAIIGGLRLDCIIMDNTLRGVAGEYRQVAPIMRNSQQPPGRVRFLSRSIWLYVVQIRTRANSHVV